MAYNKFTIETARKTFGLTIVEASMFVDSQSVKPSEVLRQYLERYLPLGSAIGTEKARSEFIIAPVLAELIELTHHSVSLFSGIDFDVDAEQGLTGRFDFLISASGDQYMVEAPILAVVEAKKDDIHGGLGQCMAEMVAGQIFNTNEGVHTPAIYGCVTTGSVWRFLKLQENQISIEKREYFIDKLDEILGVLLNIVTEKKG